MAAGKNRRRRITYLEKYIEKRNESDRPFRYKPIPTFL
jgi:hypothetical protein